MVIKHIRFIKMNVYLTEILVKIRSWIKIKSGGGGGISKNRCKKNCKIVKVK